MNYQTHITMKSSNAKTGPIPVSTTTGATCPKVCPFRTDSAGGCYAASGPLALHWAKVTKGERGGDWDALCAAVAGMPEGQLWRHNQAGDLPGDGESVDALALAKLTRANEGRKGFTYSHYSPTLENIAAIRAANAGGFTVNLSANSMAHADELAAHGLPVVTVLPKDATGNGPVFTPAGRRVVICPATYREDTSCATCGLCQSRASTRPIVGFPAHGTGAKRADAVARRTIPIRAA